MEIVLYCEETDQYLTSKGALVDRFWPMYETANDLVGTDALLDNWRIEAPEIGDITVPAFLEALYWASLDVGMKEFNKTVWYHFQPEPNDAVGPQNDSSIWGVYQALFGHLKDYAAKQERAARIEYELANVARGMISDYIQAVQLSDMEDSGSWVHSTESWESGRDTGYRLLTMLGLDPQAEYNDLRDNFKDMGYSFPDEEGSDGDI